MAASEEVRGGKGRATLRRLKEATCNEDVQRAHWDRDRVLTSQASIGFKVRLFSRAGRKVITLKHDLLYSTLE